MSSHDARGAVAERALPRRRFGRVCTCSALALALGLAACGRDGALEAPPAANVPAAAADPAAVSPLPRRAKSEPIARPHEPFILDPLL